MPAFRSPMVAATLSFVVPGLGQASLGSWRRAAAVGLPTAAVAAVVAVVATGGADEALDLVLDPTTFAAILVLNVALAAYHAAAVADAYRLGLRHNPGSRISRTGVAWLAVLLAATLAVHGGLEALGLQANGTLDAMFPSSASSDGSGAGVIPPASFGPDPSDLPEASPSPNVPAEATATPAEATATPAGWPTASPQPGGVMIPSVPPWLVSPTPAVTATPSPTPRPSAVPAWARDGRLNLLLIGADAGPDRWSLRTDTMIVLSVSTTTGRTALFGIPRNLVNVPLAPESARGFPDGRYPYLLNSLYVYAMGHPDRFPGGQDRGYRAVAGAVQELVGVPLDGMAVVNLGGFVQLVDALGGLWIDVPERLVDTNYPLEDGSGWMTLDIRPGCQHLDGRLALAYARSRHQDSDYGRMARQQEVLVALRHQLDPLRVAAKASSLLSIAGANVWTSIPRNQIAGIARLAASVDARRIRTILFVPSAYPARLDTTEIARIRSVVGHALDKPIPVQPDQPSGASCR